MKPAFRRGPESDPDDTMLHAIEARYPGRCGWCQEWYEEGTWIVKIEGEWCHEDHKDEI